MTYIAVGLIAALIGYIFGAYTGFDSGYAEGVEDTNERIDEKYAYWN